MILVTGPFHIVCFFFMHLSVFDNEFIPQSKLGHLKWKHEQGSALMFRYLIDDNFDDLKNFGLDLSPESVEMVINMIEGVYPKFVARLTRKHNFLHHSCAEKWKSEDFCSKLWQMQRMA